MKRLLVLAIVSLLVIAFAAQAQELPAELSATHENRDGKIRRKKP